jgi:hypothetical protein
VGCPVLENDKGWGRHKKTTIAVKAIVVIKVVIKKQLKQLPDKTTVLGGAEDTRSQTA